MEDPLLQPPEKSKPNRHWGLAKRHVMAVVHVKATIKGLHRDTKLMRSMKTEAERERYVAKVIVIITLLGVVMALTKTGLFHMEAVGKWDDGHAYMFGYALSLTLAVFVLKILLIFIERMIKKPSTHDKMHMPVSEDKSIKAYVMPWLLLVVFTTFEMLSGTLASMGLLYGAPASLFVVFKSSKAVFLAILSVVILKRKLNCAQWSSLLLITLALIVATIAEGKSGGKGAAPINVKGPALLLVSELCHGAMLVYQEIAVKHYWPDPVALLSASAIFGTFLTALAIYKSQDIWVELPDGGRRPFSDPTDTMYMMWTSPALATVMVLHLTTHVTSDLTHIMILKHISALARTMCDTFKLFTMWFLGKGFWLMGIFPAVAEAWHPGLIGSWLMLPAIVVIIYAMLMFKNGVFVPIWLVRDQDGRWTLEQRLKKDETDGEESEAEDTVSLDDPFYVNAFRSKKIKRKWRKAAMKVNVANPHSRLGFSH